MGRIGYRLNRVLTVLRAFHPRVFSWRGRMDDVRARVPLVTLQVLPYFIGHEPWIDDLLRRTMRTFPGVFVDVGMNIGQSLIKVKAIDPEQPVVGFEPNPNCLIALRDLVRLNRYMGVRVVPVALAETDGLAELGLVTGPADGSASMIPNFRKDPIERLERIACLRFETVERSMAIERIGVVKIDVEGAESMVLAGMEQRLARDRPVVVVEILPVYTAENAGRLERQRAIEELMGRLGYTILRLDRSDPKRMILVPIPEIGVIQDMALSNYVLCPAERVGALQAAFG
ncbi:MAG: FkbM family methyltransferase [Flavobacteriales bacterium]|nr:FkbM family methyltransferase [Flavobacteriales bacterium]